MLIKKVRLLDREGLFDIRIVDGKFTEIAENLDVVNDEEIIEGNGALASAPNKNIKEFPIKNATTVVPTATFLFFENLAKSGVAVPPLINEPTHKVTAVTIAILLVGSIFINPCTPPTELVAITADVLPNIAIAGTAIALNIVKDFIPK